MHGPMRRFSLLPLLLLAALPAGAVGVGDIPSPRPGGWAVDLTGTLQAETLQALDQLGDDVKAQTGAELAVVVVASTDGVPQRQFATELANRWGIGDPEKDNGVLVFAALEDHAAEIVLGEGIDDAGLVTVALDIMHGEMVPRFRAGDPAGAIFHGALASARRILGAAPTAVNLPPQVAPAGVHDVRLDEPSPSSPRPVPSRAAFTAIPPFAGRISGLALLATAGGLALLGGAGLVVYRRRPRRCRDCRSPMLRLDEADDDAHLVPAEQLEERLGSVDYDVWVCTGCERTEKLRYGAFFTRYATCPQCEARTASSSSVTEQQATTWSEGRMRVDERCENCDFHRSFTRRVPRRQEPSSRGASSSASRSSAFSSSSSRSSSSPRSSSGFGGGRSSGGGASGRW